MVSGGVDMNEGILGVELEYTKSCEIEWGDTGIEWKSNEEKLRNVFPSPKVFWVSDWFI